MIDIAVGIIIAVVALIVILANLRAVILSVLFLALPAMGAIAGCVVIVVRGSDQWLAGIGIGALIGLGFALMGLTDNSIEEARKEPDSN